MSEQTKTNINTFWDSINQLANSLIFLMIGLEIRNIDFSQRCGMTVLAIIIVLIGRTITVYTSTSFLKSSQIMKKLSLLGRT
ncbi:cation:proton antiporter [Metabacillus sp. HB246100]